MDQPILPLVANPSERLQSHGTQWTSVRWAEWVALNTERMSTKSDAREPEQLQYVSQLFTDERRGQS
jgi:hypothetical protein